jgi:hypothetical protein
MGGWLVTSKRGKAKLNVLLKRDFWAQGAKRVFPIEPSRADLKMKRTNEYATPTHNASTTKAYSVSFPV